VDIVLDDLPNDGYIDTEKDNVLTDVENGIGGNGPDGLVGSDVRNVFWGGLATTTSSEATGTTASTDRRATTTSSGRTGTTTSPTAVRAPTSATRSAKVNCEA
jgi:hypothetical protein